MRGTGVGRRGGSEAGREGKGEARRLERWAMGGAGLRARGGVLLWSNREPRRVVGREGAQPGTGLGVAGEERPGGRG